MYTFSSFLSIPLFCIMLYHYNSPFIGCFIKNREIYEILHTHGTYFQQIVDHRQASRVCLSISERHKFMQQCISFKPLH